jgi:hypothetical protein
MLCSKELYQVNGYIKIKKNCAVWAPANAYKPESLLSHCHIEVWRTLYRCGGIQNLSNNLSGRRLYALPKQVSTDEPLWTWLGGTYTLHGGLMVVGGLMF